MSKRRTIIIVAILGVAILIAAGVWYFWFQNTPQRLLARASHALTHNNFPKAKALAERYVRDEPNEWEGQWILGTALSRLNEYDKARAPLREAVKLAPTDMRPVLELARTYREPATARLKIEKDRKGEKDRKALKDAAALLLKAEKALALGKPKGKKEQLDLSELRGRILQETGGIHQMLSRAHQDKAETEDVTMNTQVRELHQREAEAAKKEANEYFRRSSDILMAVLKEDPTRGGAAEIVYGLAKQQNDQKRRAEIVRIIEGMKEPPAVVAIEIMFDKAQKTRKEKGQAEFRRVLSQNREKLKEIIKRDPANLTAKRLLAQIALFFGDTASAEALCKEILAVNQNHPYARLIMARVMMQRGNVTGAEQDLFRLMTQWYEWPPAFVAYAEAAIRVNKKPLALKAVRTALKLDPGNRRAGEILQQLLSEGGFADDALKTAERLTNENPEDVGLLLNYVRLEHKTGDDARARALLQKRLQDYRDRPEMVWAVAAGYQTLGDKDAAAKLIKQVAGMAPSNTKGRMAVVRALFASKRLPEAEKLLTDELRENPENPEAYFLLGRLYIVTRRAAQAREMYRKAVELDGTNSQYRLELAVALFASGELEEAKRILEGVDPGDPKANLLRLKIALAQGTVPDVEALMSRVKDGKPNPVALAALSLRAGKLNECIETCTQALADPNQKNRASLRQLKAQSLLLIGKRAEAVDELTKALQAEPEIEPLYVALARVLAKDKDWQKVRDTIKRIPGAKADRTDLAVAAVMLRAGRTDLATAVAEQVAEAPGSGEEQQNQARLLLAQCLARDKKLDDAIEQLGKLRGKKEWHRRAVEATARLQIAAGKKDAAAATLAELRKIGGPDGTQDANLLRRVAGMYLQIDRTREAMDISQQLRAAYPDDAQNYLLLANIYLKLAKFAEDQKKEADARDAKNKAMEAVQTAIRKRPGDFRTYQQLAVLYDHEEQRGEALRVLERMAKVSKAGQSRALLLKGQLLAAWGLYGPAADAFEELYKLGYIKSPALRYQLGRALAILGRKDQARKELNQIPAYAKHYVPAQLLVADLADTTDASLAVLDELARTKPNDSRVLLSKVALLMKAKRYASAAMAVKATVEAKKPMPIQVIMLGVRAYVREGNPAKASELCLSLAQATRQPIWQQLAALLVLDAKPDEAAKLIAPTNVADVRDTAMGLYLAVKSGKTAEAKNRLARMTALAKAFRSATPPKTMPISYTVFAAVAGGDTPLARQLAGQVRSTGYGDPLAAKEMLDHASKDPQAGVLEAADLLKIEVAVELGVPELGREWALALLRKRPACQAAALAVVRSGADKDTMTKVSDLLKPKDTPAALAIHAQVLAASDKPKEALALYDELAKKLPLDHALAMRRAMAAEQAGQPDHALAVYQDIVAKTGLPEAANNAAYLISLKYPKDQAKLEQAAQWAQEALKRKPKMSQLLDTWGWISHLQGHNTLARKQLRAAVRLAPTSIENHYHLGVVEKMEGDMRLARWHLEAAVALADKQAADGVPTAPSTKTVVQQAKAALAAMPAPPAEDAPAKKPT